MAFFNDRHTLAIVRETPKDHVAMIPPR